MRLTAKPAKVNRHRPDRARTTLPGYVNGHRQTVIARTGSPSTTFSGQVIYKLTCGDCHQSYGSNGCDVHTRRCPACQNGAQGEPLTLPPATLFS